MANPNEAGAKAPAKWIRVRALYPGTSVDRGNGRHYYRERGEEFDVEESAFTSAWMVKAEAPKLPVEVDPPATTLPGSFAPRSVTG